MVEPLLSCGCEMVTKQTKKLQTGNKTYYTREKGGCQGFWYFFSGLQEEKGLLSGKITTYIKRLYLVFFRGTRGKMALFDG